METLIAEGIGKSYKGRQVVRGVDLKISRGEVVGLLGPNGAGKTTSFYMIVGLVPPESGRVRVDDDDITHTPMYLRARNFGISYLPQEPSVFRKLTVEENILAVLEAQPLGNRERRTRADRLINQLNLGHIRTTRGYALSGGERRRVEIARALCIQPNFILLDEPFSGIDPIAVLELQKIIFDLKAGGNPFEALVDGYFENIVDVFQRPNTRLYVWLKPRLLSHQARGIVLWHFTGCDLWRAEAQTLRETFDLPVLIFEVGDTAGISPRDVNRLQAFVETLK